jgi:hypothetical protein
VPDIGDEIGGTSLAPDNVTSCVFDIPPIGPIDVQAPSTVAAAITAIAAINLRFPKFKFIHSSVEWTVFKLAATGEAAAAWLQYTALRRGGR